MREAIRLAEDGMRNGQGGPFGACERQREIGITEETRKRERRARGVHETAVSDPACGASALRNEAVTSGASDQRRSSA